MPIRDRAEIRPSGHISRETDGYPLLAQGSSSRHLDNVGDEVEDELGRLIVSEDVGPGNVETQIDKWALACLLLQHLSK